MSDGWSSELLRGLDAATLKGLRRLVATIDGELRITSHVAVDLAGRRVCGAFPQRGFDQYFPFEPLRSAMRGRVQEALAGEPASLDARTDDGRRINFAFLPRFESDVRQGGFFLVIEDRTDEERARRDSERLRDRLAAILRNAADVIIVSDADGIVEEANDAVFDLLGWKPDELVGRDLSVLMDSPLTEAHAGHLRRYLTSGVSGILNVGPRPLPAVSRTGEPVAIELSVGEVWIGGERKFIGVCRGIGERLAQKQKLEESNRALEALARAAEEASRAKSRFLATVSHELRTPMNGIFAVADVLAGRPLPQSDLELIEIMRRSGRDLLELLNEILDLSRVESGAMTLSREPFSPRELVDSLEAVWTLAAYAKGLELRFDVGELPERLIGDAGRIKQILSNLLNNAIKFTSAGHVDLEARAVEGRPGHILLCLSVSDTGPGIDPDLRGSLFEPFVTGGGDRTRRNTGAGLGLAISRELVGLMNGVIRAEAAPGGGARIVAEIELPVIEKVTARPASRPVVEVAGGFGRARVLVAEDHPVNRRVMGLLLDHLGIAHEMVEDGEAAVAAALRGGIDAILMDLRMPRMDGIEATTAIRAAGLNTPILAVTAEATVEEEAVMLAAGIDAVLPKPISLADLAEALAVTLGGAAPPGD